MNRFFKAVGENGTTLDFLIAGSKEEAEVAALFRPWCNSFTQFTIVEISRADFVWSFSRRTVSNTN